MNDVCEIRFTSKENYRKIVVQENKMLRHLIDAVRKSNLGEYEKNI